LAPSVSGTFLLLIGMLKLFVLGEIVRALRETKNASHDNQALKRRLLDRSLLSRLVLTRIGNRIDASWRMLVEVPSVQQAYLDNLQSRRGPPEPASYHRRDPRVPGHRCPRAVT